MHPPVVKQEALRLVAQGLNDCEIGRRLGIPRRTILDWRNPSYVPRFETETCPRCWKAAKPMRFTIEDYSELLAMYLGDGCISGGARTSRLRISLDAKYPQIIEDGKDLLERCFPHNSVDVVPFHKGSAVNLSVYSSHLPCLFPQHATGVKHHRRIALEEWQLALVLAAPWPFLRGCIRTDGCAFINRTGPYEYLSYDFANMSGDIARLLAFVCRHVGVCCRINQNPNPARPIWRVRINRRPSVALMLEHVGLKA